MSFYGIAEFDRNLRKVMDSDTFKNAGDGGKLRFVEALFKSKYGIGSFFGYGSVKPLDEGNGR